MIPKEISVEEIEEDFSEDPLCSGCNGSGEGQYDGTRCWSCGGKGTVSGVEIELEGREWERDDD